MVLNNFVGGTNAVADDVDFNFNEIRNMLTASYTGFEQGYIDCSQVAASLTYSTNKKYHLFENAGTASIYINFDTTATSANGFELKPGERLEIAGVAHVISAICSTGHTSKLKVLGLGDTSDSPTMSVYTVAVTQTNSSQALAANTRFVYMANTGSYNAYINIDAAATTNCYSISGGDALALGKVSMTNVQFIADTSKTTTMKVIGVTEW